MGKKRSSATPQRVDTHGGIFDGFPRVMTSAPAFVVGANFRMRAVVMAVAGFWNGYNNGHIGVSARQLAEAVGSNNHKANAEALQQAIDRGLLVCTARYPNGMRKAREYRLPWVSTGKSPNFEPATHDYLHWSPADERGKKHKRSFRSPVSITETDALRRPKQGKERTVSMTETGKAENDHSPVSMTATPILLPYPRQPSDDDEKAGGAISRPQSVTQDRWLLAQRRAAAEPSTPDVEFVRTLTTAFLSGNIRGSQSALARLAGVPDSTFSKFLHHGGPLAPKHRGNLVSVIVRTGFTMEAA